MFRVEIMILKFLTRLCNNTPYYDIYDEPTAYGKLPVNRLLTAFVNISSIKGMLHMYINHTMKADVCCLRAVNRLLTAFVNRLLTVNNVRRDDCARSVFLAVFSDLSQIHVRGVLM